MTETTEELIRWLNELPELERVRLCARSDPKYLRVLEALREQSES